LNSVKERLYGFVLLLRSCLPEGGRCFLHLPADAAAADSGLVPSGGSRHSARQRRRLFFIEVILPDRRTDHARRAALYLAPLWKRREVPGCLKWPGCRTDGCCGSDGIKVSLPDPRRLIPAATLLPVIAVTSDSDASS
jgi:hypothetical protein